MRKAVLIAMTLALGACATSQHSGLGDNSVDDKRVAALRSGDKDPGSDVICKSQPITGSRTSARVCYTRDEWVAMRNNSEEYVRNVQQRINTSYGNEYGDRFRNSDDQQ